MSTIEIPVECATQITHKISAGFHTYLGRSSSEYMQDFEPAISRVGSLLKKAEEQIRKSKKMMLLSGGKSSQLSEKLLITLTDPRIPFIDQLGLLGIGLDPAVFYVPVHSPRHLPYPSVLAVADKFRGQTIKSVEDCVRQEGFELATPFESVQSGLDSLRGSRSLSFSGGEFKRMEGALYDGALARCRALVLETYFGDSRVSHVYRDDPKPSVGVVAAFRSYG